MRGQGRSLLSLVSVAFVLLSLGCVAGKTALAPATPAPTASKAGPASLFPMKPEAGKYGGVFHVIRHSESDNLDPHQGISTNELIPAPNLYNQLIQYNPFNPREIVPDLAKSWEVSADGKEITFRLRGDVRWHDGKPFTSADVEFSIKRMMSPPSGIRSPRQSTFTGVAGTESPDPQTFKMTFQYARASFLANLGTGWFLMLPKHVLEEKGQRFPMTQAVGTGPFKLKAWNPGVNIQLVRNGDYFVKERPYLEGVVFDLITDSATRFAALRTGRVHMTFPASSAGLLPGPYQVIKESPQLSERIEAGQFPGLMMPYFIFNIGKAPWSDVKVRRAAQLALDRQALIKVAQGFGEIGILMNPSGPWSSSEEEVLRTPGFRQAKDQDLAEAKRLLSEAGYPSGFDTKVLLRAGQPTHEAMTIVFIDSLAKIGVRASMEPQEMVTYTKSTTVRAFEVVTYPYGRAIDDPDAVILEQFVTGQFRNIGGYSNDKVDRLAEEQSRTMDAAKRKALVMEIQRELLATSPVAFAYWATNAYGKWRTVRNYHPGIGNFNNHRYENVWLER
ncbi:MAG: ABC transporter substrate-binding protein [Chloroflexi bacterium]|nr:ABC transporter substrate-binding protein [Chloroflexota bacterium]